MLLKKGLNKKLLDYLYCLYHYNYTNKNNPLDFRGFLPTLRKVCKNYTQSIFTVCSARFLIVDYSSGKPLILLQVFITIHFT